MNVTSCVVVQSLVLNLTPSSHLCTPTIANKGNISLHSVHTCRRSCTGSQDSRSCCILLLARHATNGSWVLREQQQINLMQQQYSPRCLKIWTRLSFCSHLVSLSLGGLTQNSKCCPGITYGTPLVSRTHYQSVNIEYEATYQRISAAELPFHKT